MRIFVGSVVTAKDGIMEENTKYGRRIRINKGGLGCSQDVVGNNNFKIKFKDGQKKKMSNCLIMFLLAEEELGKGKKYSTYFLPPKCEGKLLIIYGYPVVGEGGIHGNGMNFYVFNCCCFMKELTMDMLEEHLREEIDPDLGVDEDTRICDEKENYWKDMLGDNIEDKGKVHALRC